MNDPNNPCLFCSVSNKEIEIENELSFATYDSYPVSKFHVLIIPKRHVLNYFDLNNKYLLLRYYQNHKKLITCHKCK